MKKPLTIKGVFRNPGVKLVGLGMALLLWFHVATDRDYEATIDYTLEYVNLPASLMLAALPTQTIQATAQGSGKLLLRFWWQKRQWPIDLSDARVGTLTIPLEVADAPVLGLGGIQILDLQGVDHVTLVIDSLARKTVPIITDAVWQISPDFVRVGPEQWLPDSVTVTGPKAALRDINGVRSTHLELKDRNESFELEADLAVPQEYGVSVLPDRARLRQSIEPYATGEFTELAIHVATTSKRDTCSVEPKTVTVEIGGPKSVMERIVGDSISVVCAIADRDPSGIRRSLWVYVPEPLQVLRTSPDSVTIRRDARPRTSSRN
jgi:YbbR domain-containing protein